MMRTVLFLSLVAFSLCDQCYTATTNSLSFRTCAGTFCSRVPGQEYLNYGNVVTFLGGPTRNGDYDWLNVKFNGKTGWVATNWLQQSACSASPPPPNNGGGSCAPASSSVGKPAIFGALPGTGGVNQPYGRTQFSWTNCASWYSAAGCMHNGIDFAMRWGTNVIAPCAGWITASTDNGGGNPMSAGPKSVVQHCGDWLVLFGHMSVTGTGYKNQGDVVGQSGNPSGWNGAGNDHLHFEVRQKQGSTTYSNRAVNPLPLFNTGLRGSIQSGDIVCQDQLTQPDIVFGSATKCGQWCGCPGYC